jgi:stage III sporulation protein AA
MNDCAPVLEILPEALRAAVELLDARTLEELRFRVGQPPTALFGGTEHPLPIRTGFGLVTEQDVGTILLGASRQSAYAANETLRQGYLVLPGGHRLGVCGTLVTSDGTVKSLREPSSVCIRIAREVKRSGELPKLETSSLILGPPGSGKTTLLRDCIRALSAAGRRVSVADERGELAACLHGRAQRDLGAHTDILTGCEKAEGILYLQRVMNPEWIAADEITAPKDVDAMEKCGYCGVRLLATAHASGPDELTKRPLYRKLLALGLFGQLVVLHTDKTFETERMA